MKMDYSPKDLAFADEGRIRLMRGVSKMALAVKSTLGPGGNTVLIESPHHTHGITVTKDGVTVAKSIDLIDPIENLAVKMMKEASERTATSAGDGTTTAIVLTEALVSEGIDALRGGGINRTQMLRELNGLCGDVVSELKGMAKKVTKGMYEDVATISANNDASIGRTIAKVYSDIGRSGIVAVESSETSETYSTVTHGIKFDRGYLSPLFINDSKKDECVYENVKVLVVDIEIENMLQIENVLRPVIANGDRLLIIAPCSGGVVNTIAANVMKNSLKMCAVSPPSFGWKQHELMQDIAVSVGAKYFSEKTGDDLSLIQYEDLGFVKKIVVGEGSTVLFRDDSYVSKEIVDERVSQLWAAHKIATRKSDKEFIMSRIASLTGGIGVIYVGGNTDLEQKELYDRVDDAVCAVRSALEEGILPGGGSALYRIGTKLPKDTIAGKIMAKALCAPFLQICENAGIEPSVTLFDVDHGINAVTGEYCNLIEAGVIDPLKVTRSSLQNAVSVATTILSTDAIVTMARSYETK